MCALEVVHEPTADQPFAQRRHLVDLHVAGRKRIPVCMRGVRRVGGSWGAVPCESDLSIYLSIRGSQYGASVLGAVAETAAAIATQCSCKRRRTASQHCNVCMHVCMYTYVCIL
jgi:hypothetical protein